jgi:hypothetical protein
MTTISEISTAGLNLQHSRDVLEDAANFHVVMRLIKQSRSKAHGMCEPRESRACTTCNAKDDLEVLIEAYRGERIYPAASGNVQACNSTKYLKGLSDSQIMHVMGVSSEVRESMSKHLLAGSEVVIRRQNECPELGDFAICVVGEDDYWIECCNSNEVARNLAATLGLKIKG